MLGMVNISSLEFKNVASFKTETNATSSAVIPNNTTKADTNTSLTAKDNIDKSNARPFYVALMERKLKKGTPNNCNLLYEESRYVNFSNEKVVLAKIFKCE